MMKPFYQGLSEFEQLTLRRGFANPGMISILQKMVDTYSKQLGMIRTDGTPADIAFEFRVIKRQMETAQDMLTFAETLMRETLDVSPDARTDVVTVSHDPVGRGRPNKR